jgi:hypothetical protein
VSLCRGENASWQLGRKKRGDVAPQGSQMAMALGSIGIHCARDDTTALIRISEQNDSVSHSGIARFNRANGHEQWLNLQKSCECNLGIAVQAVRPLSPAFSIVERKRAFRP